MGLAANLKRLRKKKRSSQTQLAEHIGAHLSHINRIETGKYNPSLDVVQKLAKAFDVTIVLSGERLRGRSAGDPH